MRNKKGQFKKGVSPMNGFKKGFTPWNKGISGLQLSPATQFKKGMPARNKGVPMSAEQKAKLRLINLGKKKQGGYVFGTGEKNPNWKGGITVGNAKIRGSTEYKLWRKAVFERDDWTCVWCLVRGGRLEADHIKPFAYFPELRFAIDNGRTLCVPCHQKTDTYRKQTKHV